MCGVDRMYQGDDEEESVDGHVADHERHQKRHALQPRRAVREEGR